MRRVGAQACSVGRGGAAEGGRPARATQSRPRPSGPFRGGGAGPSCPLAPSPSRAGERNPPNFLVSVCLELGCPPGSPGRAGLSAGRRGEGVGPSARRPRRPSPGEVGRGGPRSGWVGGSGRSWSAGARLDLEPARAPAVPGQAGAAVTKKLAATAAEAAAAATGLWFQDRRNLSEDPPPG